MTYARQIGSQARRFFVYPTVELAESAAARIETISFACAYGVVVVGSAAGLRRGGLCRGRLWCGDREAM